jgi:import inner membrane translocase subunit TIM13
MDTGDIDTAKQQVQGQMAAQYIQEVMQKITDKCFLKCVTKPGAKLDDSEKVCLAKCMDRYLDAMALVSQTWAARAKAQAAMGDGSLQ